MKPSRRSAAGVKPKAPKPKKTAAAPVKAKAAAPTTHEPSGLKPKHERFVLEYLIDGNAGKAYIRAGYSATASSAAANGHRLLKNAEIAAFLAKSQQKVAARAELTVQMLVDRMRDIAFADPRELVEHVVHCCRHCHGKDWNYQWTVVEQKKAIEAYTEAIESGKFKKGESRDPPDFSGGTGFDPRKGPNADCPHCMGNGHGRTFFKDTRKLSPAAAALYAGVKQTKEGIEIKMHSQLDAAEKLAKHLGMYEKDNEQKKPELSEAIAAFVGGLHGTGVGRLPLAPQKARPAP
jgi:phage terminase small subunit